MRTASIDLVLDSIHGKSMSLLPFMQWNLGSNIGNKMNAEHASIVMNSVWACSRSRCGTAEIAALEFSILETISWGDYHLQSSMHLEGIFIKDISPENFKGESVEITRNYFGLTVKIHVHSGTFMWVSKSHGSQAHLGHPVSKGSSMIHNFSRIP